MVALGCMCVSKGWRDSCFGMWVGTSNLLDLIARMLLRLVMAAGWVHMAHMAHLGSPAHAATPSSSLKLYVNQSPLRTSSLIGVAPGQAVRVELTLRNQLNTPLNRVRIRHTLRNGMKWVTGTVQGLSFEPQWAAGTCGPITALSAPGSTTPVFEVASMPAAPVGSYSSCTLHLWAMLPTTASATSYNAGFDLISQAGDFCSDAGNGYCNTNTDTETSAPVAKPVLLNAALSGSEIEVTLSNATAFDMTHTELALQVDGTSQPSSTGVVALARASQGLANSYGITTVRMPFNASAGTHSVVVTASSWQTTHADGSTTVLSPLSKTFSITLTQAVAVPVVQPAPTPDPSAPASSTPTSSTTTPSSTPTPSTPQTEPARLMSPYLQALSNHVLAQTSDWVLGEPMQPQAQSDGNSLTPAAQHWHLQLQFETNANRSSLAYAGQWQPWATSDSSGLAGLSLGLSGATDHTAAAALQHQPHASYTTHNEWQGWRWSTRSVFTADTAQVAASLDRQLTDDLQASVELGDTVVGQGEPYTALVARHRMGAWQWVARAEAPTGRADVGIERPWWWGSVVYGRVTRYAQYRTAQAAASVGTVNTLTHPLVIPTGEVAVGLRWHQPQWSAYAEQRQQAGAQFPSWAAGVQWQAGMLTHRLQAWSDQGLPTRAHSTLTLNAQPHSVLKTMVQHQWHHHGTYTSQQLAGALSVKHDWPLGLGSASATPFAPANSSAAHSSHKLRVHATAMGRYEVEDHHAYVYPLQVAYGWAWVVQLANAPVLWVLGYNFKGFDDAGLAIANATHAGWFAQVRVEW